MAEEAVLTEADGGVLLITLNRPDARNAVNAALAAGVGGRARRASTPTTTCRSAILTGAGKGFCAGMDLKAFVQGESPHVEGRGFAGIVQGAAAQADHRRDRGLRRRRRARGRARLRPDRRRARRQARHPRGQALARRRRRRAAAAAAADALPPGDGDGAHRRPDHRRARRRGRPRQPPGRAGRGGRGRARARRRDRRQRPARARRRASASSSRRRGLERGGGLAAPGRDRRPGLRLRGRPRGRDRVRREARPGLEGPLGLSFARPDRRQQAAAGRAIAVLAEVDPLPGAEREAAVGDRQRERRAEHRGLDVGGHVVGALVGVGPVRRVLGDGLVEVGLEVAPHVGRGVLVQRQRRRGVLHEEVEQPDPQLAELGQLADHLTGDEVEAAPGRAQRDLALEPHGPGTLLRRRSGSAVVSADWAASTAVSRRRSSALAEPSSPVSAIAWSSAEIASVRAAPSWPLEPLSAWAARATPTASCSRSASATCLSPRWESSRKRPARSRMSWEFWSPPVSAVIWRRTPRSRSVSVAAVGRARGRAEPRAAAPALDRGGQRLAGHGLGEVVVHPGREAGLAHAVERVGGHGDDRGARAVALGAADRPRRLVAVHDRHVQVHQHDRVAVARGGGRRPRRRCGRPRRGTPRLRSISAATVRLTALSSTTSSASASPSAPGADGRRRAARVARRRPATRPRSAVNQKVLPRPSALVDADLAAHQLDELAADAEPEPGAAVACASSRRRPG